ncbi:MAG: preprotein translocase subunit SecY [Chloroflexi bacterium]|nr:preprotein translocase subunit SecY [Chloroflexota bacterium]
MLQAFRNIWRLPDVRNKLLITGLILLVYQFAAHVPVVGVNGAALQQLLTPGATGAGLINVLNLLSGGAVRNFSVIANGVYPYITASIILQLLIPIIPRLAELQKEPGGRDTITRYTYYLAIPMGLLQAFGQIQIFNALTGTPIIPGFGSNFLLTVSVLFSMTAGTMFAVWLGELITEQGIGNGISLIIFSGIVAQAPTNLAQLMSDTAISPLWNIGLFVVITVVSIVVIIFIQEGERRIPVQYGKRVRGSKQYGGARTFIPMKVNPVGMIPLIFAQAIVTLPAVVVSFFPEGPFGNSLRSTFGNQQGLLYWGFFFSLTVFFTFFYADVMIGNQDLASNLQRNGGFIPGTRPGKPTQDFITRVTRRISLVGAVFLGVIAIMPGVVDLLNSVLFSGAYSAGTSANAASVLTGSGLIILVGVVIETMRQLEAQLVMRNYRGFMK